jgi:hypothetical protein
MADGNTQHVAELQAGQAIKFRPHGNSMRPIIESGQLVTVEPVAGREVKVGMAVLCKVNGRQMLHKVTAIGSDGRYQIGNNHGHINGWCTSDHVYGIVTRVEP